MKNYALQWMDSYNVDNHGGLKNIKKSYPIYEVHFSDDGWIDCLHEVKFKAKTMKQIKQKARKILEDNGRNVDVFSIYEGKKTILTEENF